MEKNRYNLNLNPKPLSSDEIAKHQDFDQLMGQYQTAKPPAKAAPKTFYYIAGAVAAALVGVMIYFGLNNGVTDSELSTKAYLASQPFIDPPYAHIQKEYGTGKLDASEGGVYEYENGSKLIVPAAAFVDQNGSAVSGEVDIKYREFHDFIDFYISGIPMEYDSAGTDYYLESAGMVEVYAEQNGKRLEIAPDKKLKVELVSEIMVPAADRASIPSYNVYYLDEEKRNWVYETRDQIELVEEDMTDLLADSDDPNAPNVVYETELEAIESQEAKDLNQIEASVPTPPTPQRPVRANGSDFVFNFDFEAEENGTISQRYIPDQAEREINETASSIDDLREQYANTMWQVAPGNSDFNEEMVSQIEWEDMKLRKLNNRDFELTLINPNKTMTVTVNPVLQGDDYDKALAEFSADFDQYESELASREAQLANQKAELAERVRIEKEAANKRYEERMAIYRNNGRDDLASDLMVQKKIINRFEVSNLGVWNCDRPLPPFIYNLRGEFVENQSKEKYKNKTAYLVDKNKNTFLRFYAQDAANVRFDGRSENMMWMITEDNKIAMYESNKFKDIEKRQGSYTFVMDLVDQQIESEEDLRQILQF